MKFTVLFVLLALLLAGCDDEIQKSLNDPPTYNGQPQITSMIPNDSTFAGVNTIKIIGSNFNPQSPASKYNVVYFDEYRAEILSATESEIVISSPNTVRDTAMVSVASTTNSLFSEKVQYKLKAAVDTNYASWDVLNEAKPNEPYAVAVDAQENVYVFSRIYIFAEGVVTKSTMAIYKIDRDGLLETFISSDNYPNITDMKIGPANKLHVAFNAGRVKQLKVYDESGVEESAITFSNILQAFDFNSDGIIWVAMVNGDIARVNLDGSKEVVKNLGIALNTLRVYDNHLYIAGKDSESGEQKLFKISIESGNALGTETVLLTEATSWLSGKTINSITFDVNGFMYLALSADNGTVIPAASFADALYRYDPVSTLEEIIYPGLIKANLNSIAFGNSSFIYASQQNPNPVGPQEKNSPHFNLLKIDADIYGAPYYGRH